MLSATRGIRRFDSFQIGDIAADRTGMADADGPALKRGGNCVIELVCGCRGSRTAEILIPIIDAAVIEQPAGRVEKRSLGGDGGPGAFDQSVLDIAQSGDGVAEFPQMRFDLRSGLFAIGINKPEINLAAKSVTQLLQQWRVAI